LVLGFYNWRLQKIKAKGGRLFLIRGLSVFGSILEMGMRFFSLKGLEGVVKVVFPIAKFLRVSMRGFL